MPDTVKEIGHTAFRNCESLTDVKLSANVETLNYHTFAYCKKLREIAIPDGVKELGGFLFQESSNLEKISIPKSIEKMDNATFFAVSSIEEINLDVENSNFIYENGILLSKDRTKMYTVTKQATNSQTFSIPNGITTLCEGVLNGFSHITKIIIPESVSEIKADFFPFDIEEIEIDTNNQSYISINQQICTKDKKVLCFCYSKNQVIILEEGIEEIVNGALEKCNNAIQVNFPSTLKVLSNQALKGMNNVRNITLGKNVETITGESFSYNRGLQSIEIDSENPNFMAENGAIYTKNKKSLVAFVNITATSFEIPEGVETIEYLAFGGRDQLTKIILPNTIKAIYENAFARCNGLTKLEIPNSIEVIGNWAFSECSNLREIIIDKSKGSISGSPWGCTYGERAIKWLR